MGTVYVTTIVLCSPKEGQVHSVVCFPRKLHSLTNMDIVITADDIGQQPGTFIQINPGHDVGNKVAKKGMVTLADDAVRVDGAHAAGHF